jgi:dTDP-4-dehydrorhamnose reductase
MATRLLILGRTGQLARALKAAALDFETVICAGRAEADLAQPGAVARFIGECAPGAIINAAAYTAVDAAEGDERAAQRINADAAGEAAEAARKAGARFVHVSTDYVFGAGARSGPFDEDADPAPVNAYGRTKLAGEHQVMSADPGAAIVRASAVFSGRGADFPSAMWAMAQAGKSLRVIDDQLTAPTFAGDLADRLLAVARRGSASGIFHAVSTPFASWADFAEAALALSAASGGPAATLKRIPSREFVQAAPRPADSRLSGARLEAVTGLGAAHWPSALPQALDAWRAQG